MWIWVSIILLLSGVIGFFLFKGTTGQAQPESNPPKIGDKLDEANDPIKEQQKHLQLAVVGLDGKLVERRPSDTGWTVGIEMGGVPPSMESILKDAMDLFTEIDRTGVP